MDKTTAGTNQSRSYGLGLRHVQVLMLFFEMMVAYAMRVNMSIAIVAMTDTTKENSFNWTHSKQAVILSSFFWGYVILQIPAGLLAARFGGKVLMLICIGVNSAVSMILPAGAEYGGWGVVCGCRMLQGLTQGFLFPSGHTLLSKWMPLEEKSRFGTFVYAGCNFGTALELMCGGFLAEYLGWQWIFYTIGILGAVWTAVYYFLGADSPQASKMISEAERTFIVNSIGKAGSTKKLKTPWKSIWTSCPFISLIIVHCAQNWGFFTLLTEMPSFMSQVLKVNIKANGVMSALPYLAMFILSFPIGIMPDFVMKKHWLSISATRKISNSIGCNFGTALELMCGGFLAEYLGWQWIFYTIGILGAVWTAVYYFLGADSPQASKMISEAERTFIVNSIGKAGSTKKLKTPWKSIWTSCPFISLIIVHCAQNWGFFTLLTEMPSFMSQVLKVNIKANGVMSALPYLAMFILSFPIGIMADFVIKKHWLCISATRKISNSIGHYGPAIALIGLAHVPAGHVTASVVLLTVVVGLNAGFLTGLMLVHIDMSPNFAGALMGISNFFANVTSIIAPILAGFIIKDEKEPSEWRKVFYLASAIYICGNTLFVIFGSSKVQKWNDEPDAAADDVITGSDGKTSYGLNKIINITDE